MNVFAINADDVCDMDNNWAREFRERYKCTGCRELQQRFRNQPIDIQVERKPIKNALLTNGALIGIIRRDFMALFEDEFLLHFSVGSVFDRFGRRIEDFATFIDRRPIIVRSSEAYCRICEVCGRLIYSGCGEPNGDYIMQDSIGEDHIYGVGGSTMIMTNEMRSRIRLSDWKGISIHEHPVLQSPRDDILRLKDSLILGGSLDDSPTSTAIVYRQFQGDFEAEPVEAHVADVDWIRFSPVQPESQIALEQSLLVRFAPMSGSSWYGQFAAREKRFGFNGIIHSPNMNYVCVIVRGTPYYVNVNRPAEYELLPIEPVLQVQSSLENSALLLVSSTEIALLDAKGVRWTKEAERLSSVCFSEISPRVVGQGWSAAANRWLSFELDLRSASNVGPNAT